MMLCSENNTTRTEALKYALSAGGKQAQAALTSIAFLACPAGIERGPEQAWNPAFASE